MNKTQLIDAIATEAGLTNTQATSALKSTLKIITQTLAEGDEVSLIGFGTFKVSHRAARAGRNPSTGDTIQIAASNQPTFKAGKPFKEALNQ